MARGKLALSIGVLWLISLTQAAIGLPRRHSLETASFGKDAYILSQGGSSFSTNCSLNALEDVRESLSGNFLWVRRAGKVFVIRDERSLDAARALFAPLRDLDPEHEALARKQSSLEREQEALERQQEEIEQELDKLSDEEESGQRSTSARKSLERRQRDLEPQARALELKERELDGLERAIDQREDAIEKKAEARLWHLIDESILSGVARSEENR